MINIKICVYTIACNEAKNVKEWALGVQDADLIIVGVDTKSTDDTGYQLRGQGVKTIPITVEPWSFDIARNLVLDAIPTDYDVVISLDLDERLSENWREILEKEWEEGLTLLHYPYIYLWQDDARTIPSLTSLGYKIHARHAYRWQHAVHENLILVDGQNEKKKITNNIIVAHYPDLNKPRDYTNILNRIIEEDPTNSWLVHVRAREHFNHKRYELCIEDALKYLDMSKPYDTVEMGQIRAEMCRLIARSKYTLKNFEQGELQLWMLRGVSEAPNQREAWVYLGESWTMMNNIPSAFAAFVNASQLNDPLQSPEQECRVWDNNYINNMIQDLFNKLIQQSQIQQTTQQ